MKTMKQNRRVRKIKVDKQGKISIDWEVRPEGLSTWDEYHMKCSDLARPEFYNALVDLRQDVLTLLEYPKTWLDDILVKGVSFSYSDDVVVVPPLVTADVAIFGVTGKFQHAA